MSTTQWIITLAITLLAGGAMGSVIGIIVTNRRNRIQPIAVQKEVMPFINRQIEGSASKAEIVLNVDGEKSSFSSLTLARLTLADLTTLYDQRVQLIKNISTLFAQSRYEPKH